MSRQVSASTTLTHLQHAREIPLYRVIKVKMKSGVDAREAGGRAGCTLILDWVLDAGLIYNGLSSDLRQPGGTIRDKSRKVVPSDSDIRHCLPCLYVVRRHRLTRGCE